MLKQLQDPLHHTFKTLVPFFTEPFGQGKEIALATLTYTGSKMAGGPPYTPAVVGLCFLAFASYLIGNAKLSLCYF